MLWFIVVLNNRVTQHLYQQQWDMYRTQSKHRDHRIVSISQPCARDRGRAASWANRSNLAPSSASARRASGLPISTTCAGRLSRRLGPDRVSRSLSCALQPLPGTGARRSYPQPPPRANRDYLKQYGIRIADKPLGRPSKKPRPIANSSNEKKPNLGRRTCNAYP